MARVTRMARVAVTLRDRDSFLFLLSDRREELSPRRKRKESLSRRVGGSRSSSGEGDKSRKGDESGEGC